MKGTEVLNNKNPVRECSLTVKGAHLQNNERVETNYLQYFKRLRCIFLNKYDAVQLSLVILPYLVYLFLFCIDIV